MAESKAKEKITISLTLDREDAKIFLIVSEAHPHIKRKSDIIRKGVYKLFSQMKITEREECEKKLIAKGLLVDKET